MAEQSGFQPEWSVPPGNVLAEALTERGWTQVELARRINRPVKTINEIVRGKASITPETAIQLELAMGIPARLWLNLERRYAEARARDAARRGRQRQTAWLDRFPIAELIKHGQIPRLKEPEAQLEALLRFLGTSSPEAWNRQWHSVDLVLRRSAAHTPSPEALSAWLRWGERETATLIEAKALELAPFNPESLAALLPSLRAYTRSESWVFQNPLRRDLARTGVVLVLIPELAGTRISGAARWISSEIASIQLSLRHKTDDQFWFALYHEAGHLLSGLRRRTYVDVVAAAQDDPDEQRANEFARDSLIPRESYQAFVERAVFDRATVAAFASELQIAVGIVVGRLEHDGHVPRGRLADVKRSMNWA